MPLIGRVSTARPSTRRNSSGDADTTATPGQRVAEDAHPGVRRGIEPGERGEERERVGRAVEREPAGEVHLVALAGGEQRVDARDELGVLVGE